MIQLWQQSWEVPQLHSQLEAVYRRCLDLIHDRLFPEASAATRDAAFALTAMALGNAVLQDFNLNPGHDDALADAGRAIFSIPSPGKCSICFEAGVGRSQILECVDCSISPKQPRFSPPGC